MSVWSNRVTPGGQTAEPQASRGPDEMTGALSGADAFHAVCVRTPPPRASGLALGHVRLLQQGLAV